jgi:hypothetical protein
MKIKFYLLLLLICSLTQLHAKQEPRHEIGLGTIFTTHLVGNYAIPNLQYGNSFYRTLYLNDNPTGANFFTEDYGRERYLPNFHYAFYPTSQLALRFIYQFSKIEYKNKALDMNAPLSPINIDYLNYAVKSKEASLGACITFFKYKDFEFYMGADFVFTQSIYEIDWISIQKPNATNQKLLVNTHSTDNFHQRNTKLSIGGRIQLLPAINVTYELGKRLNDQYDPTNYYIRVGMNYTLSKNSQLMTRCKCKV